MASDELPPARRGQDRQLTRASADAGLPAHPLDKRWYMSVEGETYGPYTGHELKRMTTTDQFQETDFVCPEGGDSWVVAKADPLLGTIFKRQSRDTTQVNMPAPVQGNTGTVVQVTNQMPSNNGNVAAALLLTSGDASPKSPGVALILSFFIIGAGQMYNGQVGKGIGMLLGWIVCVALTIGSLGILGIILGPLAFVLWIWSMVDGYSTAKQMTLRYQQRVLAGLMQ